MRNIGFILYLPLIISAIVVFLLNKKIKKSHNIFNESALIRWSVYYSLFNFISVVLYFIMFILLLIIKVNTPVFI